MTKTILDFVEFLLVFSFAVVAVFRLLPYLRKLSLGRSGLQAEFDFVVKTNDIEDKERWPEDKPAQLKKLDTLSLEDFKYFVQNKLYEQIPLSRNDLQNFDALYLIYAQHYKDRFDVAAENYYNHNYMFNVKFVLISEIVQEFKKTKKDVLDSKN